MPEMHLRQSKSTWSDLLLKTENEYKNLKEEEIQNVFIKRFRQSLLSTWNDLWKF